MRTSAHSPDRGGSGGWNLMLTLWHRVKNVTQPPSQQNLFLWKLIICYNCILSKPLPIAIDCSFISSAIADDYNISNLF